MRIHLHATRAKELGFPVPEKAPSILEYEVELAGKTASTAPPECFCGHCQRVLPEPEIGTHLLECQASPLVRKAALLEAQLDAERIERGRLEKELAEVLEKLTEPPPPPVKDPVPEVPTEESPQPDGAESAEPRRSRRNR